MDLLWTHQSGPRSSPVWVGPQQAGPPIALTPKGYLPWPTKLGLLASIPPHGPKSQSFEGGEPDPGHTCVRFWGHPALRPNSHWSTLLELEERETLDRKEETVDSEMIGQVCHATTTGAFPWLAQDLIRVHFHWFD